MSSRSQSFLKLLGFLSASLVLISAPAWASSQAYPLQIKVLSSEYQSLDTGTPVPKNCDLQNFDAYCNESKHATVQNVMVVQDAEGKSFGIACTVDSRWSKCAPLPVGETFDARRDKHGITVLYRNDKGKEIRQVYELLAANTPPPSSSLSPQSHPAAQPHNVAAAQPTSQAASAAASSPVPARQGLSANGAKVRCNFASTPSGAEITLDGKYVGSTPSEIAVSTGSHTVVFSMPGFGEWKRDLDVIGGSELTVSAILQKQ